MFIFHHILIINVEQEVHQIVLNVKQLGKRLHCVWECVTIQTFWKAECANIRKATGKQVSISPVFCLLGRQPFDAT